MGDPKEPSGTLDGKSFELIVVGDQRNPDGLIVQFPIKAWLDGFGDEGLEMLWGKLRRVEAISVQMFKESMKRKLAFKPGIVMPDGRPN